MNLKTPSHLVSLAALVTTFGTTAALADRGSAKSETDQPQGGVAALSCSCPADLNLDGLINGADLGTLLGSWGSGANDLTGDGIVNGADLGVMLGAWGACSAPSNDECSDAIDITGFTNYPFCTTNATTGGPSVVGQCGQFASNIFKDVWFEYHPEGDGTLTLDTCADADFDTILAVYTSVIPGLNPCPAADGGIGTASLVGCNDDSAGCPNNHSKLAIEVSAGRTYKIRLGGFGSQSGSGTLHASFESVGSQCFEGIVVNGVDGITKTVIGTTVDNLLTQAQCTQGPSKGEWITYIPTCQNQNVHLSTCHPGTNFDTVVTVWRESLSQGCDGIFIQCVDDTEAQACLLDGNYRKSKVNFVCSAGEIYHILVSGFNSNAAGDYELTIETDCFNP